MTILDFAEKTGLARPGLALVPLNDGLWRVTKPTGEVLGYIERSDNPRGECFAAKRLLSRSLRFLPIGEFWTLNDAIDSFGF